MHMRERRFVEWEDGGRCDVELGEGMMWDWSMCIAYLRDIV